MEIFIAIAVIAYFLLREKFQEYRADKYADQAAKRRNEKKNLDSVWFGGLFLVRKSINAINLPRKTQK